MNRCAYVIQGLIFKRGQGLEFEFGGRCMQGSDAFCSTQGMVLGLYIDLPSHRWPGVGHFGVSKGAY